MSKLKLNISQFMIFVWLLLSVSFSSSVFAVEYLEGEEAQIEMMQEEEEIKEFSAEEACVDGVRTCLDSVKEKIVEGMVVKRDCWKYDYIKNCNKKISAKNNCTKIQQDDFKFVGDTCLSKVRLGNKSVCLNTRKIFSRTTIQTEKIDLSKIIIDPDNKDAIKNLLCEAFCLDGNCSAVSKANQESNNEIARAAAQLEMLSNIKKGLVSTDPLVFDIFGATAKRCHNKGKGLWSNCCPDFSAATATKVGITKCGGSEKEIITGIRQGKCEPLGEYCASKKLEICLRKTRGFCCFPTVLAKTIRVAASKQSIRSLGSAEFPQCNGLTIEDIEKIDFDKVDFKEFFDREVQPMINSYTSDDKEAQIKRSFPNGTPDFQPAAMPNINKDGVNEKLLKNSDGEGR